MKNFDEPITKKMFGYQIQIFTGEQLRSVDEYMVADIIFDLGERYTASFFTLKNIQALMEKFKQTGECNRGEYFWTPGMVIVESLSVDSIIRTVDYIISSGECATVFDSLPFEEE